MLNERIKNKAIGSHLCLAAALLALVTAIVFLATQATAAPLGHDGNTPGIVLLVGVVVSVLLYLFPIPFAALIQAVIYNIALYLVVVQLYFVFADVINNVTYAGGNAGLCVFYMVATFIVCLVSVVACFCPQTKSEDAAGSRANTSAVGLLASVAGLVAVCVVLFLPQGTGTPGGPVTDPTVSGTPDGSEPFRFNYVDNTFKDKTIEELAAVPRETWLAKEANGEVAYFFEGQYTEGFSTIVDPACLDMYCCKDGSMYGSFSGPTTSVGSGTVSYVYGYWYNYDENSEYNFVIHITGNQELDGSTRATNVDGGADADVYIFDTDHGAYNWEASLSYGLWGGMMTRNINIYGQEYAAAKSLTIDASNLRTFYTGDVLDATELSATAVRGNDATESIWNGRIAYSGFDSTTPGKKTVTGSFLGATATFEVNVEPLVTEEFTGTYELIVDKVPTATEATLLVDYSHKTCSVTSADGTLRISGVLVAENDNTLTMTLNGSDPFEVVISEAEDGKQLTIPAHVEKVSAGWGPGEPYDIGESVLTLK